MAETDIKIKDAPLTGSISGGMKMDDSTNKIIILKHFIIV